MLIANQDVTSDRRSILTLSHLAPSVLTPSRHGPLRPVRPDTDPYVLCVLTRTPTSCASRQRLVLLYYLLTPPDLRLFSSYCGGSSAIAF